MSHEVTERRLFVLDGLREENEQGHKPSVRSLTDKLQTRRFRARRIEESEVRDDLEHHVAEGTVERIEPTPDLADKDEPIRFQVAGPDVPTG